MFDAGNVYQCVPGPADICPRRMLIMDLENDLG